MASAVVAVAVGAAAVVAAAVLTALYRASRGKNGVTSNGILSRAEVIATGCAFTISTRSSHGFSLTRPPRGNAAIWSSLFQSSAGAELAHCALRVTVPFSVMLLPR